MNLNSDLLMEEWTKIGSFKKGREIYLMGNKHIQVNILTSTGDDHNNGHHKNECSNNAWENNNSV